jgi:hypothetical protein
MNRTTRRAPIGLVAALAVACLAAPAAKADAVADFFKGKNVTVLSGFGAGGM